MSDYIEREAVLAYPIRKDKCDRKHANKHFILGIESVIEFVEDLPAADVAPVRHGRWIEDERTYPGPGLKNNLCSACGEVAGAWKEGLEPGRKWAYCPNCGARMDKEDEHEAD